jgi:hypothetical protein
VWKNSTWIRFFVLEELHVVDQQDVVVRPTEGLPHVWRFERFESWDRSYSSSGR